jgi:hypothetical protein
VRHFSEQLVEDNRLSHRGLTLFCRFRWYFLRRNWLSECIVKIELLDSTVLLSKVRHEGLQAMRSALILRIAILFLASQAAQQVAAAGDNSGYYADGRFHQLANDASKTAANGIKPGYSAVRDLISDYDIAKEQLDTRLDKIGATAYSNTWDTPVPYLNNLTANQYLNDVRSQITRLDQEISVAVNHSVAVSQGQKKLFHRFDNSDNERAAQLQALRNKLQQQAVELIESSENTKDQISELKLNAENAFCNLVRHKIVSFTNTPSAVEDSAIAFVLNEQANLRESAADLRSKVQARAMERQSRAQMMNIQASQGNGQASSVVAGANGAIPPQYIPGPNGIGCRIIPGMAAPAPPVRFAQMPPIIPMQPPVIIPPQPVQFAPMQIAQPIYPSWR